MYSPFLAELVEARYAARLAEAQRRRRLVQAGNGHTRRWATKVTGLLGRRATDSRQPAGTTRTATGCAR